MINSSIFICTSSVLFIWICSVPHFRPCSFIEIKNENVFSVPIAERGKRAPWGCVLIYLQVLPELGAYKFIMLRTFLDLSLTSDVNFKGSLSSTFLPHWSIKYQNGIWCPRNFLSFPFPLSKEGHNFLPSKRI